jgi:hypothetical protein
MQKTGIKNRVIPPGGRNSVVGITCCYGLGGTGIGFRWGEIFRAVDTSHKTQKFLVQWVPAFPPRVQRPQRGVTSKLMGSARVWRVNFIFTDSSLYSVLLGYEAAPKVKGILTFRNHVVSSSSRVKCHRRILLGHPVNLWHPVLFTRTEFPATPLRQPHLLQTP